MTLQQYLNSAGTTIGTVSNKRASHSKLSMVKTLLLGEKMPAVKPEWLKFGNELHEVLLLGKRTKDPNILKLKKQFEEDTLCSVLKKNCVFEESIETKIFGTPFIVIYDILNLQERYAADLKSTSQGKKDFIRNAVAYGYFRQAFIYIRALNLKSFYFIGAEKKSKKIFVVEASKYQKELKIAEKEVRWLLCVLQRYGYNSG